VAGLAVADFRERIRRPATLVVLAAAVTLGWFAVPPAGSRFVVIDAGGARGVYTSAWVGMATALAGALWLMLGGFYAVRGTVARDRTTGVGQILAATPLRRPAYLLGKFVSNLLLLCAMAGVLALTGITLQLARGESRAVHLAATATPFLVFTAPVLAITAALAVVFDVTPGLRGGIGTLVWFFCGMFLAIGAGGVPFGGFGGVEGSMRQAARSAGLTLGEFSIGFTGIDRPLPTFIWPGFTPSGALVAGRLVLIGVAVLLAAAGGLWFDRFDPARGRRGAGAAGGGITGTGTLRAGAGVAGGDVARAGAARTGTASDEPAGAAGANIAGTGIARAGAASDELPAANVRTATLDGLPAARAGTSRAAWRLLAGELRVLTAELRAWWWLVAIGLNVVAIVASLAASLAAGAATTGAATTGTAAAGYALAACWIWPILAWSHLGARGHACGMDTLLGAYPRALRRQLAEWGAGVVLAAITGIGPLVGMLICRNTAGVAHWCAAVVAIPALALLLGVATRTAWVFQVCWLLIWYATVNGLAALDPMGVVRDAAGRPAGPNPLAVAVAAAVLVAAAQAVTAARHARRR